MNIFIVGLGSNSRDRQLQMENAIHHVMTKFQNVKVSSIYDTPALNGIDSNYFNAVLVATTNMSLEETTKVLKQWEVSCGRTSKSKLIGSIPIDLDVVIWNGEVLRERDYSCRYFRLGYNQLVELGCIN